VSLTAVYNFTSDALIKQWNNGSKVNDENPSNASPFLADTKIQLCVATRGISSSLRMVQLMAKMHLVPHYKTVNKILKKMLLDASSSSSKSTALLSQTSPLPALLHQKLSVRAYSTAITTSTFPKLFSRPTPIAGETKGWVPSEGINQSLKYLLPSLNHHNIHHSTIRLVAKLVHSISMIHLPWDLAQRAKHPKTVIRQAQAALVESGCRASFSSSLPQHMKLSRGLLEILRLEGMGIIPSKDSIMIALRTSLRHGNLSGARTLMSRIRGYQYSLENEDVAELVKILPSTGAGTSSITGVATSPMYVRAEQLEFILQLRPYFTHPSFLGPYVLALGRCGSAVQIWSVWNSVQGTTLKEGVIRAFVEAFVAARDLSSAVDFIRVAYHAGYPLTSWRVEEIARNIELRKKNVGLELMTEMVIQRVAMDWGQVEGIVKTIFVRRDKPTKLSASDRQVISDVSTALIDLMATTREGTDVQTALDEVNRILGITGQDGDCE
jgi:hypothetical protein